MKHWLTLMGPKLNFKHDWTEWLGCICMCVRGGGGFPVRLSLKSQVKHSADCKRSWSSDPLSDLRSCDGTLHTNGTALLFFILKGISEPAAGSGKTAVWNLAILVLLFVPVSPTWINNFYGKHQVEKAPRYPCHSLKEITKQVKSSSKAYCTGYNAK